MITVLKWVNLALAFVLELSLLAAYAYWGFHAGKVLVVKVILGIAAPLLAAIIWGAIMAPNSPMRLQGAAYLVVKCALFSLAVAALIAASKSSFGIILAVVFVINTLLLYVWKQ
jgi:hypothetical protein